MEFNLLGLNLRLADTVDIISFEQNRVLVNWRTATWAKVSDELWHIILSLKAKTLDRVIKDVSVRDSIPKENILLSIQKLCELGILVPSLVEDKLSYIKPVFPFDYPQPVMERGKGNVTGSLPCPVLLRLSAVAGIVASVRGSMWRLGRVN